MSTATHPVFTIGHSTHPIETFLELLRAHGVTVVADVRSKPFSRFNPQFNQDVLAQGLLAHGIKSVFLGRELGARSSDPSCYVNGRVSYQRLARTQLFLQGIDRVLRGAHSHRIALMCAEKDPLDCHRTLLVARSLSSRGVEVAHILANGAVERHENTLDRLLRIHDLPQQDLFRTREQLTYEAMDRQEARIAFVDEELAARSRGEGP